MKREARVAGFVLLCAMLAAVSSPRAEEFEGEVVGVDRGDLLWLRHQGRTVELALYGLRCPAPGEPFGKEAREFTSKLVLDRTVRVQIQESSTPLRLSGSAVLPDGSLLGHRLVQSGLARWDRKTAPNDIKLQTLEDSARKLGIGLWSLPDPKARTAPEKEGSKPAAARSGKVLHWVAFLSTVLALLVTVAAAVFLTLKARRSAPRPPAPASSPASGLAQAAADPPKSEEQARAIESGREAIQELLKNLSEFVSELMQKSMSYDGKMKDHRVSIDRAMTLAGLEEIKRLLIREIEAIESTNESYRRQLDHANAKIQDQQEIMERFQIDSKMDFLTQIANRRAFETRLEEEFERAKRYGSIFSLVMIDIDHFKKVNDVYGHMAGDKVLRLVAQVLEDQTRFNDFVSRYGGEEFAILLPESTAGQGRLVAEKIRKAVERTSLVYADWKIKVTVSAGVGEVNTQSDTPETFVSRVDAALYQAKQNGRNCVETA
jgi:diguanylate cyclase (GGDEF)-like protein